MERLGIYGGTFSPPHCGHVRAAEIFLREMHLDALYVIPTFIPPHKIRDEQTSADDRLAMCKLAFSFSDKITVSDMEIRRQGKSYTSDTLFALQKENRKLFFLCGTDMFLTMDTWHEPKRLFSLASIVCMPREGDMRFKKELEQKARFYREHFHGEVYILEETPIELSSSEIRESLSKDGICRSQIPTSVSEYIRERGLYL